MVLNYKNKVENLKKTLSFNIQPKSIVLIIFYGV